MTIGFRHNQGSHDLESLDDYLQSAYTVIEVARIRCEQFAHSPAVGLRLPGIHRELGLAGYHCSSAIASQARQECLSRARLLASRGDRDRLDVALHKVFDAALLATDAIAHVHAEAPSDEIELAHVHIVSALNSLDTWLIAVGP